MLQNFKRIVAVVGHYGSGKTNLAVNLALDFKQAGKQVVLTDLDIVNPYFRSADFAELMKAHAIELITPAYARSNLDIPALTAHLDAAINTEKQLVIDVGGDDAGAAALGRYSAAIEEAGGCDLLYVINGYRYLTRTAEEARDILREIEQVSRLRASGVVNNSNLADSTTAQDVLKMLGFAQQTAALCGIPMVFTAANLSISQEIQHLAPGEVVYPVKIYVKKPWET